MGAEGGATLETLVLKLIANSDEMKADLARAVGDVDKAGGKMEAALGGVKVAFSVVGIAAAAMGAAILGATYEVLHMVEASFEQIDVSAKMADRLGLSAQAYAALALSADLANASIDTVARAASILRRQITEGIADPAGAAAQAFDQLHLSAEEMAKLSIDDVLGKVGDKLQTLTDESQKTTIAAQLLGRGFGEMDAFLRDGSEGIANAKAQIEAMGGAISRLDMAGVEKANDSWTSFRAIVQRVSDELAVQLAPAVDAVLQHVIGMSTDSIKQFGGIRVAIASLLSEVLVFGDGWVRTAQTIGGFLGNLASAIIANFKSIPDSIQATWYALSLEVIKSVELIGGMLAQLLHQAAAVTGAMKGGAEAASALSAAAYAVGRETNTMALVALQNFNDAKAAAVKTGQAARDAWSNVFTVDASGSKLLQDMLAAAQTIMSGAPQAPDKDKKPGGDTQSPAISQAQKDAAQKLEILRAELAGESEQEVAAYLAKTDLLNSLKDTAFASDTERYQLLEAAKFQHEDKMTKFEEDATKKRKDLADKVTKAQLDGASTFFSNMSSLQNTNSRKLFEIGKAAAYATTIVNTAAAAMACYKAGSEQGGPYLGAAYAAAAIVAGAVQLANISSASPGGGGSVSSGGMGVPATTGADPNSPNVGVQQQSQGQDLNIHVDGIGKELFMGIAEELNRLRGDGVVIGNVVVH